MPTHLWLKVLLVLSMASSTGLAQDGLRPNIVWVVSEDNSADYLNLYGATRGLTPSIEGLAREGLTFNHAFSNAPVCSVARTTLITGIYPHRIGAQYHRPVRAARLPQGLKALPSFLRDAGYYTTNRVKTDYNVEVNDVWDELSQSATWRNRPDPSLPFFHMQTITVSHESSLHVDANQLRGDALQTDPGQVEVPPYLPDTQIVQGTIARYFDRIRDVDRAVAEIVDQLCEDKLLKTTYIFYFSDHGGVLPRSKGYIYESGLRVPLVIRIPEAYREQFPFQVGSRVRKFVSFVDFAPTVLTLVGVDVPNGLDGQAFLGGEITPEQANVSNVTYGFGDRFGELYSMTRSVRVGNYKYIRNFIPYIPNGLQNNYRYQMLAYAQWRKLFRQGRLDRVQSRFFQPRPAEQLFDLNQDPHEVQDLSSSQEHRSILVDLRDRLTTHMKQLPDLGMYPENVLVAQALPDAHRFGQDHRLQIARYLDVVNAALRPNQEAKAIIGQALGHEDPWMRYWALIACSSLGAKASEWVARTRDLCNDPELLVRVRAAEFLCLIDEQEFDPRPVLLDAVNTSTDPIEVSMILNSIVYLQDVRGVVFDIAAIRPSVRNGEVDRRLKYLSGG